MNLVKVKLRRRRRGGEGERGGGEEVVKEEGEDGVESPSPWQGNARAKPWS